MQDVLFQPLVTPEESARLDELAERDYLVPTLLLMENAGRAALRCLQEVYGVKDFGPGLRILVLAGGGGNGGDGLALARQLANLDCRVEVRTLRSPESYSGISRAHLDMARLAGVRVSPLHSDSIQETIPDIVVDALFGVGFHGPLRDSGSAGGLEAVRLVNEYATRGAFVLALDIPSGLSALSGRPEPEAVRASLTVSFAAAKPGLCLPWAKAYTGKLRVAEIGLPLELIRQETKSFRLIHPQPGILPKWPPQIHKAEKGKVLIIGGSPGLTGAATLAALGACRAGAGLVTVAAPAGLCSEIKSGHPEIMTRPLGRFAGRPDASLAAGQAECPVANPAGDSACDPSSGLYAEAACDWDISMLAELCKVIAELGEKSALVLGPGLGRSRAVAVIVEQVLRLQGRPPLVLDADALFSLRLHWTGKADSCVANTPAAHSAEVSPAADSQSGSYPDIAKLLRPGDVLTPHAGEMLRLLGLADSEADRLNKDQSGSAGNRQDTHAGQGAKFGKLLELTERSAAASLVCARCPATLLLKGAGTLIGRGDAPLALNPFAEPNLAVGGSGDVLSGLIAALLARGLDSLRAACLGAWIHARAGALLRRRWPAGGNLASDIALCIPDVLAEL